MMDAELRKILENLTAIITSSGTNAGDQLKAIKMKIDLLGLIPSKPDEADDAKVPTATAPGPEYAYDPATEAAMKNPKVRARALNLEKTIAKLGET